MSRDAKIDLDALLVLHRSGMKRAQLAEHFDCTERSITRALARAREAESDDEDEATDLRSKALRAIDRALNGDDARAISAAKEALAEHRREQVVDAYCSFEDRTRRVAVRLAAERLGAAIRATEEPELLDLYHRAASLMATPEDVDALADALDNRPDLIAVAGLSDA